MENPTHKLLITFVLMFGLLACNKQDSTEIESDSSSVGQDLSSSVDLDLHQECRPLRDIENYPYSSLNVKNARDLDRLSDIKSYYNMNNVLDDFLNEYCQFNDVDNVLGTQNSFQLKNQVETINRIEVRFDAPLPFCLMSQSGDTKIEDSLFGFSLGGNAGLRRIGIYGEDSFLTAESEIGAMGFLTDSSKSYSICLESDFKKYIWFRKQDASRRFFDDGPSFIYTYLPEDYPVEVGHHKSFLKQNLSSILYEDRPLDDYLDTKIYSISEFSQEDENWLKERGYTRVDNDSLGDSNTYSLSDKTHFGYGYYFECKNHRKVCVEYNPTDSNFYATKRFSFEEFKSISEEEIDQLNSLNNFDFDIIHLYLDFINLKDWKIEELTPYQFGNIMRYISITQDMRDKNIEGFETYAKVSDISIDSIRNLTGEHIQQGKVSWIFSDDQIQAIQPEGMKHINLWVLTPDIIRLLNRKQLNNVVKNIDKTSERYPEGVERKQIQSIAPDMIRELSFFPGGSALHLTKEQIEAVTPEQIQTTILNLEEIDRKYFRKLLTPEQVSWLSPVQMKAFVEACEKRESNSYCPRFNKEQLGALSFDSFKVLYPNPKEKVPENYIDFYTLSKEKILYLRENEKFSEIARFVEDNEGFFNRSSSYVNTYISSRSFEKIYYLDPEEFRNISLEQMNSFPDYFFKYMPSHKLLEIPVFGKWLPPKYVGGFQFFNPARVGGRGDDMLPMTKEFIRSIPLNQIPDIDPEALRKLDLDQFQSLSSDQLLAMTNEQLLRLVHFPTPSLVIVERDGVDEETKNNFLRLIISLNDNYNTSEDLIEENIERVKRNVEQDKKERLERCNYDEISIPYWKETLYEDCMSEWRLTQN